MTKFKQLLPKLDRGGYSIRLRFMDEYRGEMYFDTEFAVRRLEANQFSIDGTLDYRGFIHRDISPTHSVGRHLRVGDQISTSVEKHTRRGRRYIGGRLIKITALENLDGGSIKVTYE